MKRIRYNLSKLINNEIVSLDQSSNFILFIRLLQFLQYLAITLTEIIQINHQKDEHFSIFFEILKISIFDNDVKSYIGYITSFVNFIIFCLFLIQIFYYQNRQILLTKLLIVYLALLPQVMCFLFVSSTFKSFILQSDTNIILYLWSIFDVSLTFTMSLISCIIFRNVDFNQSTYIRDWSLLKLLSQCFQFITQVFYFYQQQQSILIFKQISALIWIGLEQIDIYLFMSYSLYDSKIIFILNMVKFGCNMTNLILNILQNYIEVTSSQYIYYFLFGTLFLSIGQTIFQRLFYQKGLDVFYLQSNKNSNLQIKILKQFELSSKKTMSQQEKIIEIGMINSHLKYCNFLCQSIDRNDVLACIVTHTQQEQDEEHLFLFKIKYQGFRMKKYSQSLARLKQYQIKNQQKLSNFFLIIQIAISEQLQQEIQYYQSSKLLTQDTQFINFTSDDLVRLDVQSDQLIPIIRKVLIGKIDVWRNQLTGTIDNIQQFQSDLVNLSNQIEMLRKEFKLIINKDVYEINISQVNNLYHLRMLSLCYSIILNDQLHSFLCEKQYHLVYSYEQTLQQDQLNSIALIQDKVSIVSISLVKNMGSILNTNKQQLCFMFNYKKVDDQNNLIHLNQLMPDFVAKQHNQMLIKFLEIGESPFFQQFRMVFGKSFENFVFPIYLKLTNDFSHEDDYVIKGIFFSGVKKHDYILFDKFGKFLGITKQIFQDLLNDQQSEIELKTLYNVYYVYYFIPDIFDIIKRFEQKQKSENDNSSFQEDAILLFNDDCQVFHEKFQSFLRQNFYYSNYQYKSDTLKNQSFKNPIGINEIQDQISLNDEIFGKQIQEFVNKNANEKKTCFVRFALWYQKSSIDGFYIMQIQDYRKHDLGELATELFAMQDVDSSIKKSTLRHLKDLIVSKRRYGDINLFKDIQQKRILYQKRLTILNKSVIMQTQQLFTSTNQTPKALFVKPEIALNSEMEEVQEVKNSSSEESQFLDDFLSEDESRKQGKLEKKVESFSRTNNFSEGEQNQNRSNNSSAISKISTNSSFFFQAIFKTKQPLQQPILLLWCLVYAVNILSIGGFGFTNYHLIMNYFEFENNSNQFMGPVKFNRYFSKSLALSWQLTLNKFNILNNSQYQIQQNIIAMQQLDQYLFLNLSQLYPIFIQMQNDGLLNNTIITFFNHSQENVEFTQFLNYLENSIYWIIQIDSFTYEDYSTFIDSTFITQIFIIKNNIQTVFEISQNLMNQLNQNTNLLLENESSMFIIEILVHTVLIFLLMLIQLYEWNKIEMQNRNISLLILRIKDHEIENEMQRAYCVYNALNINAGDESWKKFNYFAFGFNNENSRYENKKMSLSQKLLIKGMKQKHSKIFKTNINLYFHILKILLFLVIYELDLWGGYLLFNNNSNQMLPLATLKTNFGIFTTKLDYLTCLALIIKTQPFIFEKLIEQNQYNDSQLSNTNDQIIIFHQLYDEISSDFSTLYEQIITNPSLNEQQNVIQGLLDENICNSLEEFLPFCQLNSTLTYAQFILQYGKFDQGDDNSQFLEGGLIGIVSKCSQFYLQDYTNELQNNTYFTNFSDTFNILSSGDFNHIVLSHFRDTYYCFVKLLELLDSTVGQNRSIHLLQILCYYDIIIFIYMIVFQMYYSYWISKTVKVMSNIKLSLILIPHYQLTSDAVVNILKRYQ